MDNPTASETHVTVYTATWCGFCKMVKQYLTDRNIPFKEVNVEQDRAAAEQILEKTGQMGVPVIDIDGLWILGFDRPKIDAALMEKKLS